MTKYILQETGDALLQETGSHLLLEDVSVAINGFDYTSVIMADSFSLTECANRGEVGTGGFDVYDAASALTIPALKGVVYTDPRVMGNEYVFRGFTHDRTGSFVTDTARAARSWAVETTDLNVLAQDYVLSATNSADRPAETDYARVVWLLTTVFGTIGGVGSGIVPNSNTVTMEATDYRGRKPADVLAECSEATNKLWFIYDYGAGRKLYYDVATGTSLQGTLQVTDKPGEPDGSVVFAPVGNISVKSSPDRIYSTIHLTYNGGTVTRTNVTTAGTYRRREAAVLDSSISDVTLATAKADALLAGAAAELQEVDGVSIVVPAASVNGVRAGQWIYLQLLRFGIATYTPYRVIRRTITPLGTEHYTVSLGLASNVLASANGGRGSDDIWQNDSNANDDGATVIIDRGGITVTDGAMTVTNTTSDVIFDGATNGGTIQNSASTVVIDQDGITVTDGAITVTNGGAIVIIDGTSNMFKIGATGTLQVTATGWTSGDFTSTASSATLTGMGTLSLPPLQLSLVNYSGRELGRTEIPYTTPLYAAGSSGGSPTYRLYAYPTYFYVFSELNGSNVGVISLRARNVDSGTPTGYARYYAMLEASI